MAKKPTRHQFAVRKGGKWMTGHSYTTMLGYRFTWSADPAQARAFADDDATADILAGWCKGKVAQLTAGEKSNG